LHRVSPGAGFAHFASHLSIAHASQNEQSPSAKVADGLLSFVGVAGFEPSTPFKLACKQRFCLGKYTFLGEFCSDLCSGLDTLFSE
jgi:hypothetical protein